MISRDLHTHTTYSDGVNTPEEMVIAAIRLGLAEIGISDHSYTDFDRSYCMRREEIDAYIAELKSLKAKYAARINVRIGVEQDLFSCESTAPFEYVIGSSHYMRIGGKYYPIDDSREVFVTLCRDCFDGDYYALAEHYFEQLATFAQRTDVSIIGHIDLIKKFNQGGLLFDETHLRYISAAKRCVDRLSAVGKTFEINTGAISRGYCTEPYPSLQILDYIHAKGCPLILSSDAHSTDGIAYAFSRYMRYLTSPY